MFCVAYRTVMVRLPDFRGSIRRAARNTYGATGSPFFYCNSAASAAGKGYATRLPINRWRIAAASALVALAWGASLLLPIPFMRPVPTA